MDIFLYQVAVEQLHGTKHANELEVLVRKWQNELSKISLYSNTTEYMKVKLTYKLFVLSLNLFASKSVKKLPDFIYKHQNSLQRELLHKLKGITELSSFSVLLNAEEFLDLFEFDSVVQTPNSNVCYITILHNIFLDKPIHFTFKFNQSLDSFDAYTASVLDTENKKFLYALRLKQTLSPDTPSTVLDAYLAYTLADITKHVDISEHILLMQQHTTAMQTYQSTYGVLVNG